MENVKKRKSLEATGGSGRGRGGCCEKKVESRKMRAASKMGDEGQNKGGTQ